MIVNNDLSWHVCSMYPNLDWTKSAKYIVDDNSDLANKILNECPYGFTPVEDSEGNLIDVKPNEQPIEQLKQNKAKEIVSISTQAIQQGIDCEYDGKTSHYSLSDFDQSCIMARGLSAQQGKTVSWHADGEDCRLYTPQEFSALYVTVDLFITHHQTYSNQLKKQMQEMTNAGEINSINYGETQLDETHQSTYDEMIANEYVLLGITKEVN